MITIESPQFPIPACKETQITAFADLKVLLLHRTVLVINISGEKMFVYIMLFGQLESNRLRLPSHLPWDNVSQEQAYHNNVMTEALCKSHHLMHFSAQCYQI